MDGGGGGSNVNDGVAIESVPLFICVFVHCVIESDLMGKYLAILACCNTFFNPVLALSYFYLGTFTAGILCF